MSLKTEVNDTTNFDSNPPIELNKYDESIRQFCAAYEPIFTMAYSFLSSMLKEDAEILVVGAGTGMEISTFGSKNPNWKFTGVDPSSEMLSIAKSKIESMNIVNTINLFHGYTHDLPEDSLFDGATCILVMHFLPDDGSKLFFLKSISQHLRSGSPLILVDGFGIKDSEGFNKTVSAWKRFAQTMGVDCQTVEDGFNSQILKRIQFVPEDRIMYLLNEAGFEKPYRFFTSFLYGGWIATKNDDKKALGQEQL